MICGVAGCDVNAGNAEGLTALALAILRVDTALVDRLLKLGADPLAPCVLKLSGGAPFMSPSGKRSIIQVLLQKSAQTKRIGFKSPG